MIDSKELRLGNWVKIRGQYEVQVLDNLCKEYFSYKEGQACYYTDAEPIPITPDILLACDFRHEVHDDVSYYIQNKFWFCHSGEDWYLAGDENRTKPFQSIHQLQNLYFALTGIELVFSDVLKMVK